MKVQGERGLRRREGKGKEDSLLTGEEEGEGRQISTELGWVAFGDVDLLVFQRMRMRTKQARIMEKVLREEEEGEFSSTRRCDFRRPPVQRGLTDRGSVDSSSSTSM